MRRLPIDLRRAACPHAALRQTQRFPPSRQASTSAERVADGDAETMRMQGANFAVLSSRGWRVPDLAVPCPRKGFQNHWFWRRSFLPFFRRRKKGSRRRQDRSREARIATASVRTGLAMTWFLHEVRCKPGFRSSGRPTPVCRLPIDLRRAACPHAAPRQTQRFPPSRQASTSAERVADGDAETMRKQGANFAVLSSRGWRVPDLAVSCPRKGFQNHWFWRRSFLPFFRRRKKGSRRRQDRSREVRIATASVRTGFAMTWFFA